MASLLPTLAASLCLFGLFTAQGLPTPRRSHVTSSTSAERGLPEMPPVASPAQKSLTKRDISINQDLRSLANMLLTQEYNRIRSERRNREFLRKIGKRGTVGVEEDYNDFDDDQDLGLLPWEPFGESWARW